LKKIKRLLKKTDEIIYDKIASPALVSFSILLFFLNVVNLSIPPIVTHPYSPYFKVLNLYFFEIPVPDGLLLYYSIGSSIGLLLWFFVITYMMIKRFNKK